MKKISSSFRCLCMRMASFLATVEVNTDIDAGPCRFDIFIFTTARPSLNRNASPSSSFTTTPSKSEVCFENTDNGSNTGRSPKLPCCKKCLREFIRVCFKKCCTKVAANDQVLMQVGYFIMPSPELLLNSDLKLKITN